ncbi:unnamed protein product [Bemisia tabaci]|uniref:DNA helicase MCM8 n=1 Tax=Bemisia tabaci TaxID=7038 RepID=A0A9P0A1N6_BEMTA|nr:unnamed protein product [Bemisia tabaci]
MDRGNNLRGRGQNSNPRGRGNASRGDWYRGRNGKWMNRNWRGGGGRSRGGRAGGSFARNNSGGRNNFDGRRGNNGGSSGSEEDADDPGMPSQNEVTTIQGNLVNTVQVNTGPYKGWKLYFPEEAYRDGNPTVHKIKVFELYIQKNKQFYSPSNIQNQKAFPVDVKSLIADEEFLGEWSSFNDELTNNPEHVLNSLSLAMHQYVLEELEKKLESEVDEKVDVQLPTIRARVSNFEPLILLKNLKANYYGKLVSIKGTVIRVGNTKLQATWLAFKCSGCEGVQSVRQPEGSIVQPTQCPEKTCRSRSFTPLQDSSHTQTVNWQLIRLQEILSDDQREGGRVPRTVECELTEDLIESCVPGDLISLTGIVKVRNTEESMKKGKTPSTFQQYIKVVSVVNEKSNSQNARNSSTSGMVFDIKDYYAIQEIHSNKHLFRLLVHSLCPTIYGHEMVKAGLLLALFGGALDGQGTRGNPHILVVGDPGLGKSQMLHACVSVAPRGAYVCGNTSTTSGLTVTLSREGGGDFALEAGALVLSDQGCCCIDEFDKMSSQHNALLEAMEQQCVSIAKAGVVCSLPARTSVLAAANPVGGHYNKSKTVAENLKLGSALLSRFDLVFILLDQPNELLDSLLSEHVMAMHSKGKPEPGLLILTNPDGTPNQSLDGGSGVLSSSLRMVDQSLEPVPHHLLRKYIAYARKYVTNPVLSKEARSVLQTFYRELRGRYQPADATLVTTRQLESLIRLTQARAKVELREEATARDAMDVVELMRWSLIDNTSAIEFQRSGSGQKTRSKAKQFIRALEQYAEHQSKNIFSVKEMKSFAQNISMDTTDFYSFISNLNTNGFLLSKGNNMYQLATCG